jgi:hypothetical protein
MILRFDLCTYNIMNYYIRPKKLIVLGFKICPIHANIPMHCNRMLSMLYDYLKDLRLGDLFSDHVMCFNSSQDWTSQYV